MLVVLDDGKHAVRDGVISVSKEMFLRLVTADQEAAKQCIPKDARASICVACINRTLNKQDPSLIEDAETVLKWSRR